MSSWNSAPAYTGASLDSLRESIGIPQFSGSASENWAFVFNGLIFQGGFITVPTGTTAFNFQAPFTQQVLGVFLQSTARTDHLGVASTTLNTFSVEHSGADRTCYWFAIGV